MSRTSTSLSVALGSKCGLYGGTRMFMCGFRTLSAQHVNGRRACRARIALISFHPETPALSNTPIRSALYLPANKDRAVEKARNLSCDAVILDLEDSVAPDAKTLAREQAVAAVGAGGFRSGAPIIRVNDLGSPWGVDDLHAVAKSAAAAVLVPKVFSPHDLAACRGHLPDHIGLWAMVETCAAILHIDAIADAGRSLGLRGLIIGPNDLAREMRCRPGKDRMPLIPALTRTIMAARAHGLIVLDGVYNDFRDPDGLRGECAQGVRLGFDGKSLIHPDQIAIANAAFSPSDEEIAAAQAVVEAFALPENAGKGVINAGGRMLELLHLAEAQRVLALARMIAA